MTANAMQKARSALMTMLALAAIGWVLPARQLAAAEVNTWKKVGGGVPAWRTGGVLVYAPDAGKMLFLGGMLGKSKPPEKDAHYVQAFDPAAGKWGVYSESRPKNGIHPYYQTAYDPRGKKLYCLSQIQARSLFRPEGQMYSFDLTAGTWTLHGRDPALKDMHWNSMALDPEKRRLVVIGADKRPDNIGWSRTAIYDIESGKWSRLPLPSVKVVKEHKDLAVATETLIELIGRTRLAWYRDPEGTGTAAELKALHERCTVLGKMPGMANFKDDLKACDELISARKTLEALKSARALQVKIETHAEARYPVPPSRRNSPMVYDAKNRCMMLFGGDHEDYLMNDTWILDMKTDAWRRARPKTAPSPRAGHMLVYLPASGKVAMHGGYLQSNSSGYYGPRWSKLLPIQVWLYDAGADSWDLVTSWTPKKGDASQPGYHGSFYGFYSDRFSPPALAADGKDCLFLASEKAAWKLKVDPARCDAPGTKKMGTAPNQRLYRKGFFRAAYCEVPDPPPNTNLDKLPANKFVKLPAPPRDTCQGDRSRVWGTAVWDPDRDQIIVWGGGHCVHSENPPIHYSPASGRMVEGYDAQESYTHCGQVGSTMMNRAWVGGHSYNTYGYDPRGKVMVTCNGYVYDPSRMDWLRSGPIKPPFPGCRGLVEPSKHGAVVLAPRKFGGRSALWLFDRGKGWSELAKPGQVPAGAGCVYDSRRDRLLFAYTGGWRKTGDGGLVAFNFKDRRVEKLSPANAELGKLAYAREIVYVEHADWLLFGTPYPWGKDAKQYVRAYDCAGNRWMLLKPEGFPIRGLKGLNIGALSSQGWLYDAKRKLVYVVDSNSWAVWALRLDPKTVKILTAKPEAD